MDTKKIEALLEGIENKADIMATINAENGKDVQKYKLASETAEGKLTSALADVATYKGKILDLEVAQGDSVKLQAELDLLKGKISADEQTRAETTAQGERLKRFEAIIQDKAFKHELVKKGVFSEFEAALQDKANTGKSDADIFTAITTDKDYFASGNPVEMGVTSMNGQVDTFSSDDMMRKAMGLEITTKKE